MKTRSSSQLIRTLLTIAMTITTANASGNQAITHTDIPPLIDGDGTDAVWSTAPWHPINHLWLGTAPSTDDFSGRYKLLWHSQALYLHLDIRDDVLSDQHADPLVNYWDDDCVEIFIDADASGGDHLHNHNAFAYHVGLDNQAVDIGIDGKPHVFEHVTSRWQRTRNQNLSWEMKINVYDDSFRRNSPQYPIALKDNMKIGFMLAYCDNDGNQTREHFMGSHPITPIDGDKNLGYKTADVFQTWTLLPATVPLEQ